MKAIRALTPKTLVAIGGITRDNAVTCWNAGADSVADHRPISTRTLAPNKRCETRITEWHKTSHFRKRPRPPLDATTLVMGSMIGSGIFIVSGDVARQVQSPGLLMVCWLVAATLTVVAALSYGELTPPPCRTPAGQ